MLEQLQCDCSSFPLPAKLGLAHPRADAALGQGLARADSSHEGRQEALGDSWHLDPASLPSLPWSCAGDGAGLERASLRGNGVWEARVPAAVWVYPSRKGSKLSSHPLAPCHPAGQHSRSLAARMPHPASVSFIFRLCLLLSHLLLCGLDTISQEQVARDGGETSLLMPPRGLGEAGFVE